MQKELKRVTEERDILKKAAPVTFIKWEWWINLSKIAVVNASSWFRTSFHFVKDKLEAYCYIHNIELKFIQPGKPMQNSRVERFNGSMRREFFNAYIFSSLDEVRDMAKEWIDDYNYNRPHTILNKLSPVEYLEQYNLNANYSDLSCPN